MILEKLVIPIGFDTGLLLEGIKAIEGLITGAIDRTRDWAEGMDQLGDVTGMSSDKLAAWSFVAKKAGVDIETLSSATVIMAKGLLDSSGELSVTGKALQDFGIDVLDAGGKVRDQSDLMNDIGKKYAEFGTQTERVDFLTNVFGRSGAKLVDVFDTMAQEGGIDRVKEKVKSLGLVLDPTQYEDFQRNLNEVDLTFTGLANAFTGPLLPAADKLLGLFKEWLQAPWVANAIKNIGEKLGTLLEDINIGLTTGDWSKFWGDAGAIWEALKQKVTEALQAGNAWLDANPTAITDFINRMITSLTNVVTNTPSSALGIAAQDFVTKIGQQVAAADWSGLNQALGDALTNAMNSAIDQATAATREWFNSMGTWIQADNASPGGNFAAEWLNSLGPQSGGGSSFGHPGRAAGGAASGLTWVGERGRELVDLPRGSNVNNAQTSASMGFDYYKLAAILAVEFAKARD